MNAETKKKCCYARCAGRLLVLLALLWIPAFVWFYQQLPRDAQPLFETTRADAVVVLTGSKGRLEAGIELLKKNHARMMFVSGVGKGVKLSELIAVNGLDAEDPLFKGEANASRIMLGPQATDTIGNAVETAEWIEQKHVRSVLLVTSYYHMPRSMLELRAASPDITLIPMPIFADDLDREAPWRSDWRLILLEFHKYLFRSIYLVLTGAPR